MKNNLLIFLYILLLFISSLLNAREKGQIEITTKEGIEVFQNEKYYLLKDDVNIISDNFELSADKVKAYFDKDLYDIISIDATGNAKLTSPQGISAIGNKIEFDINNQIIIILGINSKINLNNIEMFSNNLININNAKKKFNIIGKSSKMNTSEIEITASEIKGKYINLNGINEIEELNIYDDEITNIKTTNANMNSKRAIFNKKSNTIELFENVKIVRKNEIIIGEYAYIDMLNESYKVKSKNNKKVKILIESQTDE